MVLISLGLLQQPSFFSLGLFRHFASINHKLSTHLCKRLRYFFKIEVIKYYN